MEVMKFFNKVVLLRPK